MTIVALVLALAVLASLAVMQLLIIAGCPVGEYAWGGQQRMPTPRLRGAAAAAIVLYAGFALLLMSRTGILPGGATSAVTATTWVLFAYCAISIVMNAASRSKRERLVQTPVSVLLALSVFLVALGGPVV